MSSAEGKNKSPLINVPPYHYIHVLNLNTYVTVLHVGPKSYVCKEDEKVVCDPTKMFSIPRMKYCIIENPVLRNEKGDVVFDEFLQAKIQVGDVEYRFAQDPFPLYPGEVLKETISDLPVVSVNAALKLKALTDFETDDVRRIAGQEWLFEGPGVYYPQKEVEIVCTVQALTVKANEALVLKALNNFVDRTGVSRIHGQCWLWRQVGSYLPDVFEEIVEVRSALELSPKRAIHIRALQTHKNVYNKLVRFGEEMLITHEDTDSYILDVNEKFVDYVDAIILKPNQYCVIENYQDENGVTHFGEKKLVRGEKSFFLKPGECLEDGVNDAYLLTNDEGLILQALVEFEDTSLRTSEKVIRRAGDCWLLRGPMEYIPPIEVSVLDNRSLILLDANEGIYVRNLRTGRIATVIGKSYMLDCDEELWEKKMPSEVLQLLNSDKDPLADRGVRGNHCAEESIDLTRVVTFRVPHNAAVQIYDFENKKSRVEFGPTLAMLGPDEQFTRISLSGGKPKKPNTIKSLCLLLGPDFCTDVIVVETADHARLSLQLSYNWMFDVPVQCSQEVAAKFFLVPDFIGDLCKTLASRIRGTVASVQFDDFHKHSSRIICASVFGLDENDKIRTSYMFPQNNLMVTNIDVQSVEPVDKRTRDSLQKSVQLAIEITTSSQEATARHEAERLEQEAQGRLEKQKIEDQFAVEEAKRSLLEIKLQLAELECTGQAKAEARSRVEGARIESEAAIENAKLRAEAMKIETSAELDRLKMVRQSELSYKQEKETLDLNFKSQEMELEINRFKCMVEAIGPQNLSVMATAESDHKIRMLSSLGLQSTLITDGTTPVNLLNTANGLIGSVMGSSVKQ